MPVDWEKLSKAVLVLSSDKDGEVVAAARTIGRLLKSGGMDWHSFANGISRAGGAIVPKPIREEPKTHFEVFTDEDIEALKFLASNIRRLINDLDREFVRTMVELYNERDANIPFFGSDKQRRYVQKLREKLATRMK